MRFNSSGKAVTIFLVIVSILLVSLTAISVFIFQKEKEARMDAEQSLEQKRDEIIALKTEIREIKRKNFLLQEKNKEADERINSLMDEVELEKGLREEVKRENAALQEKLDDMTAAHKRLDEKLKKETASAQKKISELQAKLELELKRVKTLEAVRQEREALEKKNKDLQEQLIKALEEKDALEKSIEAKQEILDELQEVKKKIKTDIHLEPIVINSDSTQPQDNSVKTNQPSAQPSEPIVPEKSSLSLSEKGKDSAEKKEQKRIEGRIISVDRETEFVIINLGRQQGIKMGQVMSVYRGKEFLGDIKVTRVEPKMSAADLIPPFSSRIVNKNDQVVFK